ncbi:MAG TPA: serine/threonine-protein kinase [Oculatellaceae cyanobacterium]
MTTTPGWNREESGNTPTSLPPAQPAQLSDYDETQPSMRRNASELSHSTRETSNQEAPLAKTLLNNNSADDNLVGTIFAGRYEVLELLGRGGMGAVYKTRNRINRNLRALKMMHAHLVADPQVFRRFQQEATAAARINHPNAITIIDMGMAEDGRPYLIMDYLDGMSLSQLLKYKRKLRIKEAVRIFLQMCGALAEAHSHGVIHRDIKPSNVMLLDGPDGEYIVKVVDFGIAKVFPQEGDPTMKDTTTGELFGSPPYMSPEQCLGKRLDYRSDIYSMGCLMYEVLTGSPPLIGQNALGTMYRQINEMPTPLSDLEDDVRLIQRLDEIISKTLQKNPDNRYQTIIELQGDLASASEYSAKKIQAFSAAGLQLQTIQRAIWNSMGSAKKTVLVVLLVCLLLCGGGVAVLAPYLISFDPTEAERRIAWQQLPSQLLGDWLKTRVMLQLFLDDTRSSKEEKRKIFEKVFVAVMRSDNSNKLAMLAEFLMRDLVMANEFADEKSTEDVDANRALEHFTTVLLYAAGMKEGVLPPKIADPKNPDALKNDPNPAHEMILVAAEKLNAYLDRNKIKAPFISGCLDAVVGFQVRKLHLDAVNKDAKFANAIAQWEQAEIPSRMAECAAPLMSSIGDYFAEAKNFPLAIRAYALAEKTWGAVGARGLNNAGVAADRLGRLHMQAEQRKVAISDFDRSFHDFTQGAGTETLDCARVLFDKAEAQWADGEYRAAIGTHSNAMRIWSQKKTNK